MYDNLMQAASKTPIDAEMVSVGVFSLGFISTSVGNTG